MKTLNNTLTLVRTQSFWNYFHILNGVQLEKIHFFKDGEILFSSKWLSDGNNQVKSTLEINYSGKLIANKRKIDLNSKDCFRVVNELYLNIDCLNIAYSEKMTEYKDSYKYSYEIILKDVMYNYCHKPNAETELKFESHIRLEDKPHTKRLKEVANKLSEKLNRTIYSSEIELIAQVLKEEKFV